MNKKELENLIKNSMHATQKVADVFTPAVESGLEYIRQNRSQIEEIKKTLNSSIRITIDYLESIKPQIERVLKDTAGIQYDIESYLLHEKIRNNDFGMLLLTAGTLDTNELRETSSENLEEKLFEISIKDSTFKFLTTAIQLADQHGGRREQLSVALRLHRDGDYWSSIPLFAILVEGVINDLIISTGVAHRKEKGIYYFDDSGKEKKASGLSKKIELLVDSFEIDSLDELKETRFVLSDEKTQINLVRNAILHGDNLDYATRKQSTQYLFLLFALLSIASENFDVVPQEEE